MTTIKQIVLTPCLLLVLFFSGCAPKTVYVPQACLVEKPTKTEPENCKLFESDFDFMQCVVRNYINLQGDFSSLEVAFEGCK